MFWWRGRGLWMVVIIALPIVSAGNLGPRYIPFACLASASFLYVLKDWLGDSSLYSIPVRGWQFLLVGLALLIFVTGR